jgi:hypothetical protein
VRQSLSVFSVTTIIWCTILVFLLLPAGATGQIKSPLAVDSTSAGHKSTDSEAHAPLYFPPLLTQSPLQTARFSSPVLAKALFFQPSMRSRALGSIDLMAAWKLERASEEEFSTWNMILGTAVLGGAAYCGYEHIRKYGLW